MKIKRQIDVFDHQTEKLVREIEMVSFELDVFKKRFDVKADDPLMYKVYEITPATMDLFPTLNFDFKKYAYYVSCYQD